MKLIQEETFSFSQKSRNWGVIVIRTKRWNDWTMQKKKSFLHLLYESLKDETIIISEEFPLYSIFSSQVVYYVDILLSKDSII